MVTFAIVSQSQPGSPPQGHHRKIVGGPLYDLAQVQGIVQLRGRVRFWTRKSAFDAKELSLEAEGVGQFLLALRADHYRDSEWCTDGRAWAACDSYVLLRKEWVPSAGKAMLMEYFLKFAVSKSGTLVLMVSCHVA